MTTVRTGCKGHGTSARRALSCLLPAEACKTAKPVSWEMAQRGLRILLHLHAVVPIHSTAEVSYTAVACSGALSPRVPHVVMGSRQPALVHSDAPPRDSAMADPARMPGMSRLWQPGFPAAPQQQQQQQPMAPPPVPSSAVRHSERQRMQQVVLSSYFFDGLYPHHTKPECPGFLLSAAADRAAAAATAAA